MKILFLRHANKSPRFNHYAGDTDVQEATPPNNLSEEKLFEFIQRLSAPIKKGLTHLALDRFEISSAANGKQLLKVIFGGEQTSLKFLKLVRMVSSK